MQMWAYFLAGFCTGVGLMLIPALWQVAAAGKWDGIPINNERRQMMIRDRVH